MWSIDLHLSRSVDMFRTTAADFHRSLLTNQNLRVGGVASLLFQVFLHGYVCPCKFTMH